MAERIAQALCVEPGTAPPSRGRSASVRGEPSERIATIVSLSRDAADAVAVPGDAVAAVAIEAQPRGDERLAELARRSARSAPHAPRRASGGGAARPRRRSFVSRGTSTTESYICRRSACQGTSSQQRASKSSSPAGEPAGPDVDPRAVGQRGGGSARCRRSRRRHLVGEVEQRPLKGRGPWPHDSPCSNGCSTPTWCSRRLVDAPARAVPADAARGRQWAHAPLPRRGDRPAHPEAGRGRPHRHPADPHAGQGARGGQGRAAHQVALRRAARARA